MAVGLHDPVAVQSRPLAGGNARAGREDQGHQSYQGNDCGFHEVVPFRTRVV